MPRNIQVHHFVGAVQHRSAVLVILVEDIAPDFHYFILNCKPCCKKKKKALAPLPFCKLLTLLFNKSDTFVLLKPIVFSLNVKTPKFYVC